MGKLPSTVEHHLRLLGLTTKEIEGLSEWKLTDADVARLSRAAIGQAELERLRAVAATTPMNFSDLLWGELLGFKLREPFTGRPD